MLPSFVNGFKKNVYEKILENPVIKRHHEKYVNDRYAPAWKTLEFMTLGNLINLFQAIKDLEVKKEIAGVYGCSVKVFVNYLETIRVIRNKCAHGNCLYNLELAKGIKTVPANISNSNRHNINGAIDVISYLLGIISNARKVEFENNLNLHLEESRESKTNEVLRICTNFLV